MDTDGYVSPQGTCEFYQSDKEFAEDFRFLLSTMGIKSTLKPKETYAKTCWRVKFCTDLPVATIPHKADRLKHRLATVNTHDKRNRMYLSEAEEVSSVPVRCLQVDNPDHLFLCGKTLIPTHNTTAILGEVLHYVLFNDDKKVAILGDKEKTAKKILRDIKTAYEMLPFWMQQGVAEWNKLSVAFENNTLILTGATEGASIRGEAINLLILDEFAHIGTNAADDFMASVMPTITSGTTTKMAIISTPKGLNHYYKLWSDAEAGRNDFSTIKVHWSQVPGRTQEWADAERKRLGDRLFEQEHAVSFLGSSGALISPATLTAIPRKDPLFEKEGFTVYDRPEPGHSYFIGVDTSYGKGFDYSAFTVIDITEIPYRLVALYNSNTIDPMVYPDLVHSAAKRYNEASILVEVNDVGLQTANSLHYEFEYENLLFSFNTGRAGQVMGYGGGRMAKPGVKMTMPVKKTGCTTLKSLIEENKLLVESEHVVYQLSRFVQTGKSFEAEEGYHDDIVMSLVMFAWATTQPYFLDLTDTNVRQAMFQNQLNQLEESIVPAGFWSSHECFGVDGPKKFVDAEGTVWSPMK